MRDLLVGRNEQITAWPSCPVADDACFNIYCWFHANVSESESLTCACRPPLGLRLAERMRLRQDGACPSGDPRAAKPSASVVLIYKDGGLVTQIDMLFIATTPPPEWP